MTSKIGHAAKPARDLAEVPSLLRSIFDFAIQVISFGKARRAVPMEEAASVPGPEIEVTFDEILNQLGSDHVILHDVRCQFGHIGHLVLSKPHGILLLETKTHSGRVAVVDSKIRVNGQLPDEDLIAETLRVTYWLVEELRALTGVSAGITPLLVFTNAMVEESRELKGVTITNRQHLLKAIQEAGKPMPPEIWAMRENIVEILAAATLR